MRIPSNVLSGRYASELKGLTKKLLFSKKEFHAKFVAMVFECYFFITSSCTVM